MSKVVDPSLRSKVLLSIQRALVGTITPNVRAIVCRWSESAIDIRAMFDDAPSSTELEIMSVAETEVMSDFPKSHVQLKCIQLQLPNKVTVDDDEVIVYGRREH